MFKKSMLFFGVLLLFMASVFAYAGEKFTVSGVAYIQYDGDVYVNLVTRESFQNRLEPLSSPFGVFIKLTPAQKKARRVSFQFTGIPKGNYCVYAFQDLNKNRKLDRDTQGFWAEPCGTYKTFEFAPQWDTVKFKVDKDISGIEINL